jgi:CubicO group peptidase (beta-lactamase class C family)
MPQRSFCALALAAVGGLSLAPASFSQEQAKAPAVPDQAHCTAAADYSTQYSGRAVLVQVGGKVVFERYDNGWGAERPHPLASGSKSFTGVAAMFAVQDGLLKLDELASDTLTEWKTDPLKSKITIRHLLTLSSGLDPADDLLGGRGGGRLLGPGRGTKNEPQARDIKDEPENLFAAALEVEMTGKPGEQFKYGPSHYYAFGELLQRKLRASTLPQKTVFDYYQARIFDPLGLRFRVGRDRSGNPKLPGGVLLTAREWGTFGQFVLQRGSWTGADGKPPPRELLEWEILKQCFEPSKNNPGYGLTWWLLTNDGSAEVADGPADESAPPGTIRERLQRRAQQEEVRALMGADGKPITIYLAAGKGKQRMYVIPQYDMVVVRFAEDTPQGIRFSNTQFLGKLLGLEQGAGGAGGTRGR